MLRRPICGIEKSGPSIHDLSRNDMQCEMIEGMKFGGSGRHRGMGRDFS